jgi:hypothetical protein
MWGSVITYALHDMGFFSGYESWLHLKVCENED